MRLFLSLTVLLGIYSSSVHADGDDTPLTTKVTLNVLIQNAVDANAFNNPSGKVGGRTQKEFEDVAAKIIDNSSKYFERGSKFAYPIEQLVTIYCHNSHTRQTPVTADTIGTVTDPAKGYVFILHGWTDTYKAYFVNELTKAYFTHIGDTNICAVDYGPIAQNEPFQISEPHSFDVAEYLTHFVRAVSKNYNVPYSMFTFIGHSLGAHISGNVGNYLNGELGAIFAADPCGLGCSIRWREANNSLHAGSAKYVQTIATNRNKIGPAPEDYHGHQIFWPNNGGPDQPGCGFNSILCAHYRAIDFLIFSFNRKNVFGARKCHSQSGLKTGDCEDQPCDRMGIYADGTVSGNFFLFTGSEPPYAENDECPSAFQFKGFDKISQTAATAENKWKDFLGTL